MYSPSRTLKSLAIVAILGTGLIHIMEARDSFSDATYKGLLSVANGLGALVASRTIGLPGLPAEPDAWFEPMGVASLVCEGLFVVLFAVTQTRRTGASQ